MRGESNELKNVVHVIFSLPCVVEKFRKQEVKVRIRVCLRRCELRHRVMGSKGSRWSLHSWLSVDMAEELRQEVSC